MTTTLRLSNFRRTGTREGFTLVELLISLTISVAFIAVILNMFFFVSRGAVGMGNYTDMNQQSRRMLELFGRDIRAADSLTVASPTTWTDPDDSNSYVVSNNGLTLSYPSFYDSTGMEVTYTYDSSADTLTRQVLYDGDTSSQILLRDVDNFQLVFYKIASNAGDFSKPYNLVGPLASVNTWTKSIQLDAELRRDVVGIKNTDYIISARFMMRN